MIERDKLVQILDKWANLCNTIEGHLQSCQTCVNLDQCADMRKYRDISRDTMVELDELLETV